MCRFVAYLGPPVTLEALLLAPPHSLRTQSWAPRRQRHGSVNADGFGVGWYAPAHRPTPAVFRSTRPMWGDRSFASIAGVVASGAVLAAVRDATLPSVAEESGTPPFHDGRWLFAHNGVVERFHDGVAATLRRRLSDARLGGLQGGTDSEVLFALVMDRIDEGTAPGEALAATVGEVGAATGGRLNLVLTDGERVSATASGDSLFVTSGHGPANGGVVVASEPFDEGPAWRAVPDGSLVEAAVGDEGPTLEIRPLHPPGRERRTDGGLRGRPAGTTGTPTATSGAG